MSRHSRRCRSARPLGAAVADDDAGVAAERGLLTAAPEAPPCCARRRIRGPAPTILERGVRGHDPGHVGGNGRFSEPPKTGRAPEFTLEMNPCLAGVLGNEDIARRVPRRGCTGTPTAGDRGDRAARRPTGPADATAVSERGSRELGDGIDEDTIDALRGARGAARIGGSTAARRSRSAAPTRTGWCSARASCSRSRCPRQLDDTMTSLADVTRLRCRRRRSRYAVRELGPFTVRRRAVRLPARVHANNAGRCVVDPDADPLLQGRAALGTPRSLRVPQPRGRSSSSTQPDADQTLRSRRRAARASAEPGDQARDARPAVGGVVPVQLLCNPVDQQAVPRRHPRARPRCRSRSIRCPSPPQLLQLRAMA